MNLFVKTGQFIGNDGKTRFITLGAVIAPTINKFLGDVNGEYLNVGVAICNPSDKYDQNKGWEVVCNRIQKNNCILKLYSSRKQVFTYDIVTQILRETMKDLVKTPAKYIDGYFLPNPNKKEAQVPLRTTVLFNFYKQIIGNNPLSDSEKEEFINLIKKK